MGGTSNLCESGTKRRENFLWISSSSVLRPSFSEGPLGVAAYVAVRRVSSGAVESVCSEGMDQPSAKGTT